MFGRFSAASTLPNFPVPDSSSYQTNPMKKLIAASVVMFCLSIIASSQMLTNDLIRKRIDTLGAEKNISLTYDDPSKMSKLMAVSENFSKDEASRSGILAMNLAIGFYYPGDTIVKSPESFLLVFWVLSKKPRFAASHSMSVALSDEVLVIGSARYAAKPREQMEYLNFEISRESLTKIANRVEVPFKLGDEEFTFTKSQMKLLADMLVVTDAELRN